MNQLTKTPLARAAAVAGVSLLLGLLFDQLFFKQLPGLSFPLYVAGIAAGVFGLAVYLGLRPGRPAWLLALPLLGFASMVAVRSSPPLVLMDILACGLLLLLIAKVAFRRELTSLGVKEYAAIALLPLKFFEPARHTIAQLVASHRTVTRQSTSGRVLRGIALTLPVLAIFLLLFSSADLVVGKYVGSLIKLNFSDEFIVRTILITLSTLGLLGGYSYLFHRTGPETVPAAPKPGVTIGKIESSIMLASVNALFLAFIAVQLTYLFGGQSNISALGFTYAEYARKGFFELLTVAVVAFALLWNAEKYVERTDRGHSPLFKVLSVALTLQVILIMGSAFKRLYLYEQAYGFTALRLYSHAFTVLLAVIFIILAYKIIRSASTQAFAFPAFLAVIAFLACLNAINPDAFIARQNIARYQSTGKIDVEYLGRLSADAAPVLAAALPSLKPADAAALAKDLDDQKANAARYGDWQSWNLSRTNLP
jgi:hypothetical protein